ncbi:MAG: 50S ribosomal protein L30 [Gammaproteobacteria bacterium]|nr:50S ribosomal protein L30 [Gammaproteobacteria bacterium]
MSDNKVKVTLVRSTIGRLRKHKGCVTGLGLRRVGSSTILEDTPAIRGMIQQVSYLLKVETL